MSDDLFTVIPNHQTFVLETLLTDLKALGWGFVRVTEETGEKPAHDVSEMADAMKYILDSVNTSLEFFHEQKGHQIILIKIETESGRIMITDWTTFPSFDLFVSRFVSDLPRRILSGVPDSQLTGEQLRAKHEVAGEHACFTKQDWKDEVSNDATLRGYWDWVEAQIELTGYESEAA